MLIIAATKHDPKKIRFCFYGAADHIEVARRLLETNTISEWHDVPEPALIVEVSPMLILAIESCQLINSIDGAPFVPLFVPLFLKQS